MVWTRAKSVSIVFLGLVFALPSFAQESLWKTVNDLPQQDVPSYNGGLSPFPQKQKVIEEVQFEEVSTVEKLLDIEEEPDGLTEEEQKVMLTTSILAEIKDFLASDAVFIPNLDDVVVEAVAKANGEYKTLVSGTWRKVGDTFTVPVNEALDVLNLLENLREVDQQLAESVEQAVLDRTEGKDEETITITEILEDRVVLEDTYNEVYVINFIKAPY